MQTITSPQSIKGDPPEQFQQANNCPQALDDHSFLHLVPMATANLFSVHFVLKFSNFFFNLASIIQYDVFDIYSWCCMYQKLIHFIAEYYPILSVYYGLLINSLKDIWIV